MGTFIPPASLVEAVRDQTLVPFVGAGVSVGAVRNLTPDQRFPDWNGLIRRLTERLKVEGKADAAAAAEAALPDTMAAAQLAVDALGRPLFLEEMERAFGRQRPPVGANLSAAQAIWRLRSPFVITTNYDLVLEWPWEPAQVQRIHNDDPSYLAALQRPSSKLRVWHLHGSIDRVDTIILTSAQYLKLYPDESQKRTDYQYAFNEFQQLLANQSFLFVGFSLAEPVLRRKLEDVLQLTAHAAPIKFLLLKAGEADDARKADLFDRFHVQVVEFEDFGPPMIAAIDAIGRAAWRDAPVFLGPGLTTEMEPLVRDLLEQVANLVVGPDVVSRAYNACKPKAWEPVSIGGDGVTLLQDVIVRLGGAVAPSQGELLPLLDFANRLTESAPQPWLGRLELWLNDAVERLAADVEGRDRLRQLLAASRAADPEPEPGQVLVRIRPGPAGSGQWLVHAWSWRGTSMAETLFGAEGRVFKEGASGEVVYALFVELESRDFDPDLTGIAFIVPSALACEAIHSWGLPASVASDPPIGARYTVTVRPLERMERAPLIRGRFRKAWNEFRKHAASVLAIPAPGAPVEKNQIRAVLLDASAALKRDLQMNLEKLGARCVVLREAPCATSSGQLAAVLDTTTPAIVWCRGAAADASDVERAMTLLQSGPIADIPRRIRDERIAAYRDETGTHRGMHLTLVWDDTDYVPPEHDPDARARLETT